MKKTILVLAMIVAVGFTFTSCKNDKKEEVKEETTKDTASNEEVYQCPMDCEHGKSYTEAGKCPVCKMDLKAKKAGEAVNEDSHDHDADAICTKCGKDKEECTCPKDHADVVCTKCPEGKCTCSAKDDAKKECTKCGKDKECTCPKDKKA